MATVAELAAHLDVSERTVRELRQRGVIPPAARGQLDLGACRVAYIRHLRERAAGRASDAADDEKLDLVQQRARESKERADKLASGNARDRGELVPVSAVTNAVIGMVEMTKARLLRVPAAAAGKDAKLREKVERAILDAMQDLSVTRIEMAGEDADGEEDEGSDPDDAPDT